MQDSKREFSLLKGRWLVRPSGSLEVTVGCVPHGRGNTRQSSLSVAIKIDDGSKRQSLKREIEWSVTSPMALNGPFVDGAYHAGTRQISLLILQQINNVE